MRRLIKDGRSLWSIIAVAALLLLASAPASARAVHGRNRDRGADRQADRHAGDHRGGIRAALPPGAVGHIYVIELENEDADRPL